MSEEEPLPDSSEESEEHEDTGKPQIDKSHILSRPKKPEIDWIDKGPQDQQVDKDDEPQSQRDRATSVPHLSVVIPGTDGGELRMAVGSANIIAFCKKHGPYCTRSRTIKEHQSRDISKCQAYLQARGRPIGHLVAWLRMSESGGPERSMKFLAAWRMGLERADVFFLPGGVQCRLPWSLTDHPHEPPRPTQG